MYWRAMDDQYMEFVQGVIGLRVGKKQFRVGGMTCINCQNKIEKTLINTEGITQAQVSYESGMATVSFDSELISFEEIKEIIEELDYEILPENHLADQDISRIISILVIVISLYVLLQQFGILNLLVPGQLADSGMGYGMLFVTGLITSVHCIAMCGGINLSQSIAGNPGKRNQSGFGTYVPSLLYNLGRVLSYTVIGFLLGGIGFAIGGGTRAAVPVLLQGILKLIAGLFMVIMGINMLGIFPWLRRWNIRMPKFLAVRIGKKKAESSKPFVVGLLNGLMPCGPLQSMQIVALASGNPFTGALSMLLFSLGTVPLMLGLGTIVSALGKKFARSVMNVGAVLVVVLGLAMISQGGSLSGMLLPDRLLLLVIGLSIVGVVASLPFSSRTYRIVGIVASLMVVVAAGLSWQWINGNTERQDTSQAMVVDGVQMVRSTLTAGEYPTITVQQGIPVRWTIDAPDGSVNGCNYKMIIQDYGIEYAFEEGTNIIEFTPDTAGTIPYSCWMGMIQGNIVVTEAE